MTITLEAIRAAGGIVHSDGNIFFRDISMLQGLAGAAPAAVAPQGEYPHEQMDAMALARYKVVPSHASMLWSHAVVAGDGAQQLYVGREVECQNMARKFAGAFLDGAFAFHSMAAAPTAQAAPALEAPAAETIAEAITNNFRDAGWSMPSIDAARVLEAVQSALSPVAAPQAPAAPMDDLAQLVKQLVRALRKAAPGNDLADKALDYLKRQGLQGSPLRATPEAPQTHAGLLAAAAHIQAKAQAHLDERGSYDPDTGAVEMSESNQEHFNTLDELAEEIRLMADKAAPASCDKPPAGWTCSRASGHDGPCAAAPAAPAVDAQAERDTAFEAVRKRLCGLPRYSFVLDDDGVVRREQDRIGNWIEFDDAHELFDPVAVDAAIAAQAKEGGGA